ncbi:MAG: hypothetical protein ACJ8AK_05515 [Gemmatimonadaceae bacterium]
MTRTRRAAVVVLFVSIAAIAIAYGAALATRGTSTLAPWIAAIAVPISLTAIMILGAVRGDKGIGRLGIPFGFVALILIVGFLAALILPATESSTSSLWLGLPMRAAIVIYGIGVLPIIVLPVAYALTFETQTLSAQDVERVRELGRSNARNQAQADT